VTRLGWKSNGFTPRKQAIYLEALADGASRAQAAAAAAQVSPTTPGNYEKKDEAFASLSRAARARAGGVSMGTRAWERGVTGIEEDIVQGGKVVGRRLKRSDAVFKMILEGGDSGFYGPAVKALREKIEKELRPRVESEIRAEIRERMNPREVRKRLEAKLADFNRRMGGDG
jgi:hypothetical protein